MEQISNEKIYEFLLKLESKIDNLSKDVLSLKNNNINNNQNFISFEEWLENSYVTNDQINTLLLNEKGYIDAFKKFIENNNNNNKIPINFNSKKLCVLKKLNDDNVKWIQCDFEIEYIIQEIWRKFLDFYMNNKNFEDINIDVKDLHRLKVLQMKQNLYNIEKNRKYILKWLGEIV
tara:strand:+ start:2751 stop:3278 length:528 start_codon:yes stop_codon:yes gene_type:complete